MPKFVILWTDAALFALVITVAFYAWRVSRADNARATWARVLRRGPAMCSAVILAFFVVIGLLDSIHFQPRLPVSAGVSNGSASVGSPQAVAYSPEVVSLLDTLLKDTALLHKEKTYSAPLAWQQFTKESILQEGGQPIRDFPRLRFGGRHLDDPQTQWLGDVFKRGSLGALTGLLTGVVLVMLVTALIARSRRQHQSRMLVAATSVASTSLASTPSAEPAPAVVPQSFSRVWCQIWRGHTDIAWRAMFVTTLIIAVLLGVTFGLASGYHVLGTDRTGNDVLWQALKSIRTAWVIGSLTTVAMLPPAIMFGLAAGYFRGWIDDVIQYIYTTLTSIPGVLLIAACVLMMQVYIDTHSQLFPTSAQRADLRLFLLCMILGLTGWAGLCRLLRAEVMKLRELEYVQAARAFGVSHFRIMFRHLLPNVMHIILITLVLEFSGLVLYEAVLSYLGIGVDPTMNSFGTMIDKSRMEMSRDPMVWWGLLSAFVFMLTMVLAANLFADGVRDAFDPRSRPLRPARLRQKRKLAAQETP